MGQRVKTTYQRGVLGKVFIILFYLFHIVWIGSIVLSIIALNSDIIQELNKAERADLKVGIFGMMALYPVGLLIFWPLIRLTRGPAITNEPDDQPETDPNAEE